MVRASRTGLAARLEKEACQVANGDIHVQSGSAAGTVDWFTRTSPASDLLHHARTLFHNLQEVATTATDSRHHSRRLQYMASLDRPETAIEALRAILETDNQHERHKGSPIPAQQAAGPASIEASHDTRASSLVLLSSNADFPVIATTTIHCVPRKRTEQLCELEAERERPMTPRIGVCTWPGQVAGRLARGKET